jgi:hypothetical protein
MADITLEDGSPSANLLTVRRAVCGLSRWWVKALAALIVAAVNPAYAGIECVTENNRTYCALDRCSQAKLDKVRAWQLVGGALYRAYPDEAAKISRDYDAAARRVWLLCEGGGTPCDRARLKLDEASDAYAKAEARKTSDRLVRQRVWLEAVDEEGATCGRDR